MKEAQAKGKAEQHGRSNRTRKHLPMFCSWWIGCRAVFLGLAISVVLIFVVFQVDSYKRARTRYSRVAVAIVKNFSTAAAQHTKGFDGSFWENGTTDFGSEFSHCEAKGRYFFYYFSNDENMDGKHEATSYVYLAVPESYEGSRIMVAIDESNEVYYADLRETDFGALPNGDLKINWKVGLTKDEDGNKTWARIPGYEWKIM